MRVVTGYVNGKPQYRDEGPAFARVQGHGGAALGQATVTFVLHQRSAIPLREKDRRRKDRRMMVMTSANEPPRIRVSKPTDTRRSAS